MHLLQTEYSLALHLESRFNATLNILLDDKNTKISRLFEVMTLPEVQRFISDWSISLGSLEDVFLNVVKKYRGSNIEEF